MWRIWLLFDPRRAIIGMAVFLMALALLIHFILLSTDRFNWIEGPRPSADLQIPASTLAIPAIERESTALRA